MLKHPHDGVKEAPDESKGRQSSNGKEQKSLGITIYVSDGYKTVHSNQTHHITIDDDTTARGGNIASSSRRQNCRDESPVG